MKGSLRHMPTGVPRDIPAGLLPSLMLEGQSHPLSEGTLHTPNSSIPFPLSGLALSH